MLQERITFHVRQVTTETRFSAALSEQVTLALDGRSPRTAYSDERLGGSTQMNLGGKAKTVAQEE